MSGVVVAENGDRQCELDGCRVWMPGKRVDGRVPRFCSPEHWNAWQTGRRHERCKLGKGPHEMTPDNVVLVEGRRRCRACKNERQRRRRAARS